jgi:uncharacterized protein
MTNLIIIHGAYGNPQDNWIPWLKKELEKIGCKVFVPKFPTPESQSLENWMEVFEEYKKYLDEDSVLIGHSVGAAFILSVLEKLDRSVKAAFLVAGWLGKLGNPAFDKINKTFVERNFNWGMIRKNCKNFIVYGSDNDTYVPLEKEKELAGKLGVELKIVKGAGHFNDKYGYVKFDLLLENVKNLLEKGGK